jgi:hypothetical protein
MVAFELMAGAATSKKGMKVLNRIKSQRRLFLQRYGSNQRVDLSAAAPHGEASPDERFGIRRTR